MIVLTTSASAQTFSFIPRDTPTSMVLTDDQTNTPVTVVITSQTTGDYVNTITADFTLEEGHFYDLVLYKNTDIVYKDRIFCTDQNIVTFSVNNGQYTSNTTSNTLRAEKCNKDGEIEAYYYSDDWTDVKKYPPTRIPAYGYSKDKIEILFAKPYAVGMKYYSYVDYNGAVPYALLEEEVADYLINEVQNGFSGTKVVNFNNGVPTEEQQSIITNKVLSKLTGSKGQKVIVAFNDNMDTKTTVDDLPLNDAPEHYTYLSEECMRKIMLGHNVTSPATFRHCRR
jgi:hypothetical protein